ncbi:hypothetical protein ABPG74_009421 [Tetrahymena malaccensis]
MNTIIAENQRNFNNQNKQQPLIPSGNAINEAASKIKLPSQIPANKPTKLKKVGDYIFIKQIGSGAYSTVHQGRHNQTQQKVAIKMIPNSKLTDTVYQRKEKFDFPEQIPISEELKNLLRRMLTVDPQKRLNFKELFSNKWITGEFKPGMKGNEVETQNIDLTQSLKYKKEQAKEIQIKQKMQQNQMQIVENEEQAEEEQKETVQEYLETQVEEGQEKDLEDIDIQSIQEANLAYETPTPYVDEALLQTHEKAHLNQINIQKEEHKQEKVLIAGVMKFALSLRKYYEKRIIIFIANCKKYMDFFENVQNSLSFKNNSFYRNSAILSAIIVASRISDFVKGNISVKIESETHNLGTYSSFTGLFLENGESDQTNFIHILKKKQAIFVQIIQKLLANQSLNVSSSNSPEFLFMQNLIKTYSLHQATANNQHELQVVKDMQELIEIYEKLQLPQLQLHSIIRRQGIDVKKLFGDLNNMFNLIQDTIKTDKKYVKYQSSPFEIKIGLADIAQNEQQFNEIQKKLSQILNINSEKNNSQSFFCGESLQSNN